MSDNTIHNSNITISSTEIRELFNSINAAPSKKLGQNYLVNPETIQQIIDIVNPKESDNLIEIGPGLGAITLPLASKVNQIVAYEIDPKSTLILKTRIKQHNLSEKIEVIEQDYLKANKNDCSKFAHCDESRNINFDEKQPLQNNNYPEHLGFRNKFDMRDSLCANEPTSTKMTYKIFSSLPYSQYSPILHKLIIQHHDLWNEGIFLVQKEVAEKISSASPKASYWSNFIQGFYSVNVPIRNIPQSSFWPNPKVKSSLIKLTKKSVDETSDLPDPQSWSNFLHQVFKHPRKQILKSINKDILKQSGIDPTERAERLAIVELTKLCHIYKPSIH